MGHRDARSVRSDRAGALAVSAFLPELALFGRYTRQPERVFDTGDGFPQVIQEENVGDGRVSLNLTLLEARSFPALERAEPELESVKMRAKESERLLGFERAMDDIATEVERSLVQLARAKVALTRAETRAALAKKNTEEVSVRYREGVASAFELTDAGAGEFAAGAELARARFELGASILAIRRIAGEQAL